MKPHWLSPLRLLPMEWSVLRRSRTGCARAHPGKRVWRWLRWRSSVSMGKVLWSRTGYRRFAFSLWNGLFFGGAVPMCQGHMGRSGCDRGYIEEV